MDSRPDTYAHIHVVQQLLNRVIRDLLQRSEAHDQSKLHDPEVAIFDTYTPQLATTAYGSDAYKGFLAAMKPALDHHYAVCRHHPQHFAGGIQEMNLLDLLEMVLDWVAATQRLAGGDVRQSIEINQARFGYSDDIKRLMINTVEYLHLG